MNDDRDSTDSDEKPLHSGAPRPEKVASRADGRPPEERSSDDAKAQAEAILDESEERVAQRSARSAGQDPS